jgi:hypothetical protein
MNDYKVAIKDLDKLTDNAHLDYRLSTRVTAQHTDIVKRMLRTGENVPVSDYALIYDTGSNVKSASYGKTDDSNGRVIVVIFRGHAAKTVFYRRAGQNMSAQFFGVQKVYNLTA